jgi:hypothetical protein
MERWFAGGWIAESDREGRLEIDAYINQLREQGILAASKQLWWGPTSG